MLVTRSVHESMKSDLLQQLPAIYIRHVYLYPGLCYAFTLKSLQNNHRTLAATLVFASGGIVGWHFALALALPFVFIYGADLVTPEAKMSWMVQRWMRLFMTGFAALLISVSL